MTDQPDAPQPDAQPSTESQTEEDHGAALEKAEESIRQAQDAEGDVAANDDITTQDDQHAGEDSEDPDGEGGHP